MRRIVNITSTSYCARDGKKIYKENFHHDCRDSQIPLNPVICADNKLYYLQHHWYYQCI